jgi:hypothetical protein
MLVDMLGLVLCMAPVLGALAWQLTRDQRAYAAAVVRADIHAGVTRALGGETFLAIDVESPRLWRRGHVTLSAPRGYESLLADATPTVFDRLPAHYDVVIHCGGGS